MTCLGPSTAVSQPAECMHQDAHGVIPQSGQGVTPGRGLRGSCRAGDQEVPIEEAACPMLNSPDTVWLGHTIKKQHCRPSQMEHFPFSSPAHPGVSAPQAQCSHPLLNPWHQEERKKEKVLCWYSGRSDVGAGWLAYRQTGVPTWASV